ncbi:MAG: response regulator [Bacteroidota bacterium]|nr:response regulator [Bacteroidota bacterium]
MNKEQSILVVDDDTDIGTMLKMMLEYKGYTVTLLNNAGQTEQILSKQLTNLLILDMLIGGTNGTDVCLSIRKNPLTAHIPVLMISALPDARKICMDAGANDFISKPFDIQDLLGKVSNLFCPVY